MLLLPASLRMLQVMKQLLEGRRDVKAPGDAVLQEVFVSV